MKLDKCDTLDKRDLFLLLGLVSLMVGVGSEFGPAWAAIVAGTVLFLFGLLGGDK